MECKQIFADILVAQNSNPLLYNPGWWTIILNLLKEEETLQNNPEWKKLLNEWTKFLKIWNRNFKKWEISSSNGLMEKLEKAPGSISLMSVQSSLYTSVTKLFNDYANTESITEEECLALASKPTTSTSSIAVPGPTTVVGANLEENSSLEEFLGHLGSATNTAGSSTSKTGVMSSHISFLKNGESEKYGLEEKVGNRTLKVRNLSENGTFRCSLYIFSKQIDFKLQGDFNPHIVYRIYEEYT